jgi:3-oxoacyl-[acyl-carrier-protein] synthase II
VLVRQVFNDAIEALRVSYRKMNPFCVPFATTNMGSAMLAMDLVRFCIVFTTVFCGVPCWWCCIFIFIISLDPYVIKVFELLVCFRQGWMGPNYSISTACATSNFCILSAANHIIRGEAVSCRSYIHTIVGEVMALLIFYLIFAFICSFKEVFLMMAVYGYFE